MKSDEISNWAMGNSLAFRIPKLIAVELGLKPNDPVQCRVEDGKLVLELVQEVRNTHWISF
jgi:antitoxin MazE